ncbi:MAG: PocR ligand-binding domain-containing protein [Lachnospiraceae bacterium]|nr:PocR ligand-binding domain-containing protein [Lachnospiraceae bacterium]
MTKIQTIVSNPNWEKLQDSLSVATQLSLVCVNYDGTPVTHHSSCHDFCKKVRNDPEYHKYCEKCDARGGFEALRSHEPYIYKCYLDVVDIAIPIVIDHQYIGSLMAGQVRIAKEDSEDIENILQLPNSKIAQRIHNYYQEEYNKLPVLSLQQIKSATQMLSSLLTYVCQEQNSAGSKYKELLNVTHKMSDIMVQPNITVSSSDNAEVKQLIMAMTKGKYTFLSDVIKRSIDFIFSAIHHYPSLTETADACNISSSYLSRLFAKELNEGYSEFITRLKIEDAKDMLENSRISISKISDTLRYEDTGYFIKVFKKHTSLTPLSYRRLLNKH